MIRSFAQKWLETFYHAGHHKRVSPPLRRPLLRKLELLDAVEHLEDLASPPGNHLHPLHGDREGQHAISVNGPWRLCFRFKEGDVYEIEWVQYH